MRRWRPEGVATAVVVFAALAPVAGHFHVGADALDEEFLGGDLPVLFLVEADGFDAGIAPPGF